MNKLILVLFLVILSGCKTTGNVGDENFNKTNSSLIIDENSIKGLGGDLFFSQTVGFVYATAKSFGRENVGNFCNNYENILEKQVKIWGPGDNHFLIFRCPGISKTLINVNVISQDRFEVLSKLEGGFLKNYSKNHEIAELLCPQWSTSINYNIIEEEKIEIDGVNGYRLLLDCIDSTSLVTKSKILEQKKFLTKELEENKVFDDKKDKEKELLLSVQNKRELCANMGFKENTDPMANCVLKLMLDENKNNQVVVSGYDDNDMVDALNNQTQIMERQLRLQKIERNQRNMKSFQYMINNGRLPPGGFGNY